MIKKHLFRVLLASVLMIVCVSNSSVSLACGPFTLQAIFSFTVHPEFPLENYAAGELGVIQPTYARSYLFVAYRHLLDRGFSKEEQKLLVDLWNERLNYRWEPNHENSIAHWTEARAKIISGEPPTIEPYRNREKPNEYESYLNCHNDAFETAAATLNTRAEKLGLNSLLVREWVEAQDQVFANCGGGRYIPNAAPAQAEPLSRADRAYQIAAAHFYAGDFDEAQKSFINIAQDQTSPWQKHANYLIARTLVRKASLGPAESKNKNLTQAETELNRLLANPALKESHTAARRLLTIVRLRLHPEIRLRELGTTLMESPSQDLKQQLWDYTVLLDKFIGDEPREPGAELPAFIPQDELTDWILTFQSSSAATLTHALERWRARSSTPWLVAVLTKINAGHPEVEDVMSAAATIKNSSPAFPSVSFHTVRLLIEGNQIDRARRVLDELLSTQRAAFPTSTLNLIRTQRMTVATDLEDFLDFSHSVPAGLTWDEDDRELPAGLAEDSELESELHKSMFSPEAAQILNQSLPLELLKQAAESKRLPVHLRRDLAQATWLRAVMLGQTKTATELVPVLSALVPEATALLNDFDSTREDLKKYVAVYLWLKFPGFEPLVDAGVGRRTPLGTQDSYRDNWWCSAAFYQESQKAAPEIKPPFITESQRAMAKRQFTSLIKGGAAPNYISQQIVEWATKAPADRRVPEALHLAVRSTRYGCGDTETGKWSKAAYDLLHKRYPRSIWARRTPYWFKG